MKNVFILICILSLFGCKRASSEFEVNVLDYDDHSYVIFESEFGDIAVVHNPKCCNYDTSF